MKTKLTYLISSFAENDIKCIYNGNVKNTIESLYESFSNYLPETIKVAIVKNKIVISGKYNEKIATVTFSK
jgi:hypothetical protein